MILIIQIVTIISSFISLGYLLLNSDSYVFVSSFTLFNNAGFTF